MAVEGLREGSGTLPDRLALSGWTHYGGRRDGQYESDPGWRRGWLTTCWSREQSLTYFATAREQGENMTKLQMSELLHAKVA